MNGFPLKMEVGDVIHFSDTSYPSGYRERVVETVGADYVVARAKTLGQSPGGPTMLPGLKDDAQVFRGGKKVWPSLRVLKYKVGDRVRATGCPPCVCEDCSCTGTIVEACSTSDYRFHYKVATDDKRTNHFWWSESQLELLPAPPAFTRGMEVESIEIGAVMRVLWSANDGMVEFSYRDGTRGILHASKLRPYVPPDLCSLLGGWVQEHGYDQRGFFKMLTDTYYITPKPAKETK
jgi:hypothetical protein